VYLFIGNLGPGGLTRPEGLLVSAELFGAPPSGILGAFTADVPRVQSIKRLPHLVAHALMHYQQVVAQGLEAYRASSRTKTCTVTQQKTSPGPRPS
jgi:hypothetical protein